MNKKEQYKKLANIMVEIEADKHGDITLKDITFKDYFGEFKCLLEDNNSEHKRLLPKKRIKHNLVELCSELAEIPTEFEAEQNGEESSVEEDEVFSYTEEYQEIFNNHYDNFWAMLEDRGYVNVS